MTENAPRSLSGGGVGKCVGLASKSQSAVITLNTESLHQRRVLRIFAYDSPGIPALSHMISLEPLFC